MKLSIMHIQIVSLGFEKYSRSRDFKCLSLKGPFSASL